MLVRITKIYPLETPTAKYPAFGVCTEEHPGTILAYVFWCGAPMLDPDLLKYEWYVERIHYTAAEDMPDEAWKAYGEYILGM